MCDKPYQMGKGMLQKGEEFENLQNYAFLRTHSIHSLLCFLLMSLSQAESLFSFVLNML